MNVVETNTAKGRNVNEDDVLLSMAWILNVHVFTHTVNDGRKKAVEIDVFIKKLIYFVPFIQILEFKNNILKI